MAKHRRFKPLRFRSAAEVAAHQAKQYAYCGKCGTHVTLDAIEKNACSGCGAQLLRGIDHDNPSVLQ
jgi:rRNA maturation endonuclease Nob1